MGIFSRFRKKKEKSEFEMEERIAKEQAERREGEGEEGVFFGKEALPSLEDVDIRDENQREEYLQSCCDLMLTADQEIEKQKKEYQQINDCLADIHELSALPEDIHNSIALLADEAERLVNIRKQSQQLGKNRMSEQKYLRFSKYRDEMPKTLQRLEAEEQYFSEVKSDLQNLEGEKAVLTFQRKSLSKQRSNLRGFCYILVISLLLVFLIMYAMKIVWNSDVAAGYLVTVFVVAAAAVYIFIKIQRNHKERALTGKQINRVIELLNKVKIKYVNSKNAIDAVYKRFDVNSSHELRYDWEQYQQIKREEEAFSRCGRELAELDEDLLEMLKAYPIRKAELWAKRTDVLLDPEKMEQERLILEKQRKQIQESMEHHADNRQMARDRIEEMVKKYPEYGREILEFIDMVDKEQQNLLM